MGRNLSTDAGPIWLQPRPRILEGVKNNEDGAIRLDYGVTLYCTLTLIS